MRAERRREEIARFIAENDGADVHALARRFAVSTMTIRRDRKILAQERRIAPTHGGAVPADSRHGEMSYAQKAVAELDAKRAIARAAADLVEDDTSIFLDAGTTTLELARRLAGRRLTAITVDLRIALLLSQSPGLRVVLPGGEVDGEIQAQLSAQAVATLNEANVALAFIGAAAWDARAGVTCSTLAKQAVKQAMIARADRAVLLADATKYGLRNSWRVAPLDCFDEILTDETIGAEAFAQTVEAGARVLAAPGAA